MNKVMVVLVTVMSMFIWVKTALADEVRYTDNDLVSHEVTHKHNTQVVLAEQYDSESTKPTLADTMFKDSFTGWFEEDDDWFEDDLFKLGTEDK